MNRIPAPTWLPGNVATRQLRQPLAHSALGLRRDSPGMGGDTRAILRDLGFDEAEVRDLVARGSVAADPPETEEKPGEGMS